MWERDPSFLNAELIDQIKWIQGKDVNTLPPIWQRMANSRREANGPNLCAWSMLFWFHVEKAMIDG